MPRTGFLDAFGEPAQQAADLAADEIRKAAAKAGAQHKVTISMWTTVDPEARGRLPREARRTGLELPGRPLAAGTCWPRRDPGAMPEKVPDDLSGRSGDALSKAEDRGT